MSKSSYQRGRSIFKDKRILVTGACGTVGAELVRQLIHQDMDAPAEVIGLDNHESNLFFIDQGYLHESRARFFVADIRDRDELCRRMRGVDIVFHVAALKHVILSERSPEQVIQTNILGVQNVIAAAIESRVGRVIFTSSDKAVNPTNVMGTSKLMGERLITAANSSKHAIGPIFASTRFGNVLGSNGSVIPIFKKQISEGGPVTITDNGMTRFVMSVQQAAQLVLESANLAQGGEVFITKMPVVRITDLASAMIGMLAEGFGHEPGDIRCIEIGAKPGEKMYEELMSEEETKRAIELKDYFAVLPAFRNLYQEIEYSYSNIKSEHVSDAYVSETQPFLSVREIRDFLSSNSIVEQEGL